MNMSALTTLDYLILVFLGLATYKGWKRGFIGSIFSIAGAIAGVLVGDYCLQYFSTAQSANGFLRWSTQAAVLLISLSIGSTVGGMIGKKITKALGWKSFELLDHLLGVSLSFLGWSLVIWTIMTTALVIPVTSFTDTIGSSEVVQVLDANIPDNVRTTIDNWRGIESRSFDLNNTGD